MKAALHNSHGNLRVVRHVPIIVEMGRMQAAPILIRWLSSLGDPSAGVSSRAPLQPLLPPEGLLLVGVRRLHGRHELRVTRLVARGWLAACRHSPRTGYGALPLLCSQRWHAARLRWCCFPRRGQRFSKERKPPIASICGLRLHMYGFSLRLRLLPCHHCRRCAVVAPPRASSCPRMLALAGWPAAPSPFLPLRSRGVAGG